METSNRVTRVDIFFIKWVFKPDKIQRKKACVKTPGKKNKSQ